MKQETHNNKMKYRHDIKSDFSLDIFAVRTSLSLDGSAQVGCVSQTAAQLPKM